MDELIKLFQKMDILTKIAVVFVAFIYLLGIFYATSFVLFFTIFFGIFSAVFRIMYWFFEIQSKKRN